MTKTCSKCGEVKPLDGFYRQKGGRLGVMGHCKVCRYAKQTKWRKSNMEKYRQYYAAWHQDNYARWYRENPDIKLSANRRRRAKLRGLSEHFTAQEFEDLVLLCGGRCLGCGWHGTLQPDHVIPLALGGDDSIKNIQPLCPRCNLVKGARNSNDYRPKEILCALA